MKMTACGYKNRFSLKYPECQIDRYGDCNPQSDDVREIRKLDGKFWLVHQKNNDVSVTLAWYSLPEGTLWTNGYYDKEHDGWKSLSEWV